MNSKDCLAQLQHLAPSVVVINGTRILGRTTLHSMTAPVVNTLVGITPKYRGVHGAYWALASRDPVHCGVTVHLVDESVDTGGILRQALIHPCRQDDFTNYPLLQMAARSRILREALHDLLDGKAMLQAPPEGDRRWYHPTLWQHAINFLRTGTCLPHSSVTSASVRPSLPWSKPVIAMASRISIRKRTHTV